MTEAVALYTAIAGQYSLTHPRSDIRCFEGDGLFAEPVLDAKRFKVLPHLYLPECATTVWVDANIFPRQSAQELAAFYLCESDVALIAHPYRRTVWEEFAILRKDPRFAIPYLQRQLVAQEAAYRAAGLPDDTPLFECNFLIRRNAPGVNRLMDAWWSEICRWQWRDQVSFPYVLWKYGDGVRLRVTRNSNIRRNPHFRYVRHH
jgi:alkaline ceramidase TOD1/glycosyltransferase MUCI70-like protein